MTLRPMAVANAFYEGDAAGCERAIRACLGDYAPPDDLGRVFGGVVPHAGWVYSGATAAKVFAALRAQAQPGTVVLFGAVHRWGGARAAIDAHDAWLTPLGPAALDAELAEAALDVAGSAMTRERSAHAAEHSIEVQLPFVVNLFPEARILPVAAPPVEGIEEAGRAVARAAAAIGRKIIVVATTDLTHYGMDYALAGRGPLPAALPWMKENDRRFIERVERLDAAGLVAEAERRHNACGAGAVAAGVAAAVELGAAEARLLEYTTSYDVMGGRRADSAVGYAGLVFRSDDRR